MSLENVADGLISATYLVPISIAFCVAASHGKYLPLWIPYLGLLGAYVSYAMAEVLGVPVVLALIAGIILPAALGVLVHSVLFRGHIERGEPYAALLRAIAVTVFIEAMLGWATNGYTLSYRHLSLGWSMYFPSMSKTLTGADLLAIFSAIVLSPVLVLILRRTWVGLAFRSVASNRSLAGDYGIPIGRVDITVIAMCSALSAAGAFMYGMRYDLSPQMLSEPTIKVAAAVVAFGATRPEIVVTCILILGVLEAFAQSSYSAAPFASAIGYALLIVALLVRYAVPLTIRKLRI
jgi:branched-chain amino acid transport system permease protein